MKQWMFKNKWKLTGITLYIVYFIIIGIQLNHTPFYIFTLYEFIIPAIVIAVLTLAIKNKKYRKPIFYIIVAIVSLSIVILCINDFKKIKKEKQELAEWNTKTSKLHIDRTFYIFSLGDSYETTKCKSDSAGIPALKTFESHKIFYEDVEFGKEHYDAVELTFYNKRMCKIQVTILCESTDMRNIIYENILTQYCEKYCIGFEFTKGKENQYIKFACHTNEAKNDYIEYSFQDLKTRFSISRENTEDNSVIDLKWTDKTVSISL